MLKLMACAVALAIAMCASAKAERICDIRSRKIDDGDLITITGRIVTAPSGRNNSGNYEYEIKDACGLAVVTSKTRIQCKGTVVISGKYDDDLSDWLEMFEEGDVALDLIQAKCK
ncbi:MAG: hypothetical protein H6883_12140 [Rhodobiaceae bacterium]|nr:hypothetical protein [Rhodobiaceae bacterium]MCC0056876.1 hypothetical protein [Rhodobiaceae bacterium]